jgi:L-serine dehydratase
MKQPVSILNDVLGPIMRGPSSSHTAGAFRIGRLARALAGERPVRCRCTFDPSGSYAATWRPLGVDLACAAGMLGWEMTDPRYHSAVTAARDDGMPMEFVLEPLVFADHPNSVRVEMSMRDDSKLELWAKSTGGGIIEITRVGKWRVGIDGRSWEVLVECVPADVAQVTNRALELLAGDVRLHPREADLPNLVHLSSSAEVCAEASDHLARIDGVVRVRHCPPVLFPQPGESRFESVDEMCRWAEREGLSLGEAAAAWESQVLGLSEEELCAEMLRRWNVMRTSVDDGFDDERISMPLTDPAASTVLQREEAGALPLGGILTRVAARAIAVMHVCNSKGVVCAAPTGGSAGVLPAVLYTLATERGVGEDAIVRGLFAAGGVGAAVAARATFAAEIAGCQVEIGAAGAMAAAAVVEIAGGNAEQAAAAAAIALQNTMGSVCDPVGGGCEIPCHTRNAVAAANAFLCADLAVGGAANVIPLDETIDASFEVGKALPAELRCTARGGIAVTPSAERLVRLRIPS